MLESISDLTKLRVVDLKQRLSELGLAVGGLKADLVSRLHDHLGSDTGGEDEEPEAGSPAGAQADGGEGGQQPQEEAAPHLQQQQEEGVMLESSEIDASSPEEQQLQQQMQILKRQQQMQQQQQQHMQQQQQIHRQQQQKSSSIVGDGSPAGGLSSPPSVGPGAGLLASPPPSAAGGGALPPPPLLLSPTSNAAAAPSIPPLMAQNAAPPPLMAAVLSPPVGVKPAGLEHDALMQHKVRQQQLLLEQQKKSQKQEDLFRLQHQAMLEKQKEENDKQARLLSLQHEALKQNENEQKQLQALGLKPATVAVMPAAPAIAGGAPAMAATPAPASGSEEESSASSTGTGSGVTGVGSLLAALQQRRQPMPSTAAAAAPPSVVPSTAGFMGVRPLAPPPSMAGPPLRPMGLQMRPPPVGLMGHSPTRLEKPIGGDASSMERSSGPPVRDMRHLRPMASSSDSPQVIRQNTLRQQGSRADDRPPALMSLQVSAPNDDNREVRLPQALEEALAYKHQRAKQVGVELEEDDVEVEQRVEHSDEASEEEEHGDDHAAEDDLEFNEWMPASATMEWDPSSIAAATGGQEEDKQQNGVAREEEEEEEEEEEDDEEADDEDEELSHDKEIITSKSAKKDKLKKKKKKKKKKKSKSSGCHSWIQKQLLEERMRKEDLASKKNKSSDLKVDVSYVQEEIVLDYSDPMHQHFAKVFENFKISEPVVPLEEVKVEEKVEPSPISSLAGLDLKKVPKLAEDVEDDSDEEDDGKPKISKRKLKLLRRMSIAELKQTVNRPDVVEMHDVTARDPKLLVHLKATRNTVPVPRHWCFKRKYLQGKRGIEKPPFELPDFIKRTGIMEMRAALQEKEDQKTLKAKMRDKVRPKMGKIEIDYQKLHDAFFKWQSKPEMTVHGDLYYEGKEFETKMKDKKPGEMSDDLRIALGMPVGANAHKVPPPWLIAMQRYGPPPSYPNLKIPGLNAPIPDGCSFGYHAGGWGKPPVDNMGKPIYGDVFGTQSKENEMPMIEEEVEKSLWGELESESEEESEEEESSEEEEDTSGLVTPGETGLVTPSGISSLPAGLETPDMIELRKKHPEAEMEGGETPAALYTILPEKRVEGGGRGMMASTHTYDMSVAGGGRAANQAVEVALDPSELDLVDTDAMAARYEATLREQQTGEDEDFSDMVAEHAAKQRNKRRRLQHQEQNKPAKKYKDFKF